MNIFAPRESFYKSFLDCRNRIHFHFYNDLCASCLVRNRFEQPFNELWKHWNSILYCENKVGP